MRTIGLTLFCFIPSLLQAVEQDPFDDLFVVQVPPTPRQEAPLDSDDRDDAAGNQVWFGKRVVVDTWGIVSSPIDWNGRDWAIAGGAVALTLTTSLVVDRRFQDESQETRNPDKDRWSGLWGQLGTFYSLGVLGAAGTYGWLADDERGVNVLVDGLEASIIASCVISPVLKYTVGRSRPSKAAQDSDVVQPFSGETSFPSGHTTQAFTVASVLAFTYDDHPVVGGLAFVLATGVGLSRINDDMHYASDVVAGAIIGTWVGYEVVHFNRRRRGEEPARSRGVMDASVDLIFDGDRKGLSFTWKW